MLSASAHKSASRKKRERFGSLGPIPMLKHAFCSSCLALQYEPGMKFSIEQFLSYTASKTRKISVQVRGVSVLLGLLEEFLKTITTR